MSYVPLVEGQREAEGQPSHVETLHYGALVVTDGTGQLVTHLGDIETRTPLRSTAKAFQLLPLLLSGANGYAPRDLALMMSSHSGEPEHTERVAKLLRDHELDASMLQCGTHTPICQHTHEALIKSGQSPSVLHCNCSGKHVGMLITCLRNGWDLSSYLDIEHPIQRQIRTIIETLTRSPQPLPHVVDGCSLPTFVVSLVELARMFSSMCQPCGSTQIIQGSNVSPYLSVLREAAVAHPDMIAGSGRLDTELMTACGGRVFAKTGADGVYALAVGPTQRFPSGLAVAIKVSHNDNNSQIRRIVAREVLHQCAVDFDVAECPSHHIIRNNRGWSVGQHIPCFKLF